MKKTVLLLLGILFLFSISLSARGRYRGPGSFITPQILIYQGSSFLGVNYETGFSGRLNIGVDLVFGLGAVDYLMISPELIYHFDLNIRKVDLFAGVGPVLSLGYHGGADFAFKPFIGTRLVMGRKTMLFFKVFSLIGNSSNLGASFGVSFRL